MWATLGTSSTFVTSIRRRIINKAMYSTHQLLIKFKISSYLYLYLLLSPRLVQHTRGATRRSVRLVFYTQGPGSASPTRPSLSSADSPNITRHCEHNPASPGTTLRHLLPPARLMISSQPGRQRHIAGSSFPNYSANSAATRITDPTQTHANLFTYKINIVSFGHPLTIFLQLLQLQVQVGRHALRDLSGIEELVRPGKAQGLRCHRITHRLQVGLRKVGLHESQGVLGHILGNPPGEDAEPPARLLQPRFQLLRHSRAFQLKGGEDGAHLAGKLAQGRDSRSEPSLRT